MVGQAKVVPGCEHGFLGEQGNVGPAHDAQVHGIQRDHREDGRQQVENVEFDVQQCGYRTGTHAGDNGGAGGQPGVNAFNDKDCCHGGAQGKTAVHGQVREVQYAKRKVDTEGDQPVDQAGFDGAIKGNVTKHGIGSP